MTQQQDGDRRVCQRVGGGDGVELEREGRLICCHLKDISITGAAIELGADDDIRADENVVLWVEDWEPIEARVVWMTAHASGLEFTYAQAA